MLGAQVTVPFADPARRGAPPQQVVVLLGEAAHGRRDEGKLDPPSGAPANGRQFVEIVGDDARGLPFQRRWVAGTRGGEVAVEGNQAGSEAAGEIGRRGAGGEEVVEHAGGRQAAHQRRPLDGRLVLAQRVIEDDAVALRRCARWARHRGRRRPSGGG